MSKFNDQEYDVIPPGEYKTKIISKEIIPTEKALSGCIRTELEVIEGEFKGRKLFMSEPLVEDPYLVVVVEHSDVTLN